MCFNVISLRALYDVKGIYFHPLSPGKEAFSCFLHLFSPAECVFLNALHFLFKSSKKGTERDLRFLEGQTGSTLLVESLMLVFI